MMALRVHARERTNEQHQPSELDARFSFAMMPRSRAPIEFSLTLISRWL
jgi:hypothetical protein